MDWLKYTNLVIDWVVYSVEMTLGDSVHILLAFPVIIVTNSTISSSKLVLA